MSDEPQAVGQFALQKLYIKDVSFEAPGSTKLFAANTPWKPQMQVDLNSRGEKVGEDQYEVVLSVTIEAKIDDVTAFLVEVHQAGLFLIKGVEGENLRRVITIMAPTQLFPFVREAVDSLTIKGGFPPVGLQPVNFEALYLQQLQKQQAQAEKH